MLISLMRMLGGNTIMKFILLYARLKIGKKKKRQTNRTGKREGERKGVAFREFGNSGFLRASLKSLKKLENSAFQ